MSYTCEPSPPTARRGSGGKHTVHKQVRMQNASVQCAHCANMIGATVIGQILSCGCCCSLKFTQPKAIHQGCTLTHVASIRFTVASHRRPLHHTVTRRQHDILVVHTIGCGGLCASQISKVSKRDSSVRLRKERVKQPTHVCNHECSPFPRALYVYLSRTHKHTASVIAGPCEPSTVTVWQCRGKHKFCETGVHCHSNIALEGPYAPK